MVVRWPWYLDSIGLVLRRIYRANLEFPCSEYGFTRASKTTHLLVSKHSMSNAQWNNNTNWLRFLSCVIDKSRCWQTLCNNNSEGSCPVTSQTIQLQFSSSAEDYSECLSHRLPWLWYWLFSTLSSVVFHLWSFFCSMFTEMTPFHLYISLCGNSEKKLCISFANGLTLGP